MTGEDVSVGGRESHAPWAAQPQCFQLGCLGPTAMTGGAERLLENSAEGYQGLRTWRLAAVPLAPGQKHHLGREERWLLCGDIKTSVRSHSLLCNALTLFANSCCIRSQLWVHIGITWKNCFKNINTQAPSQTKWVKILEDRARLVVFQSSLGIFYLHWEFKITGWGPLPRCAKKNQRTKEISLDRWQSTIGPMQIPAVSKMQKVIPN